MSVRTTPTGSGLPTPPAGQEPEVAGSAPAGDVPPGDQAVPGSPVAQEMADVRTESRSELRAARRVRRRLMVACGVVVAVCVILTMLIVGLARDRPPGSSAPAGLTSPPPTLAVGTPAHLPTLHLDTTLHLLITAHPSTPGAAAS